jgi:hypothetical protein
MSHVPKKRRNPAARWVLLSLMVLTPVTHTSEAKDHYSARQGDLVITATKVETLEEVERFWGGLFRARNGYHFVVVTVEVRNVGRRAQSPYFGPATLQANFGIETHRLMLVGKTSEVDQMLPGEKTEGSYTFELRDGVTPLKLILGSLTLSLPAPESTANPPTKH